MIDCYVAVENNVFNPFYNVSSTYQSSATYELCKKKILIKQEGKSSLQMITIIHGGIVADILFTFYVCLYLPSFLQ